jgi:hypothetical protein
MEAIHRLAHWLISCWLLGQEPGKEIKRIPISHGILANALRELKSKNYLPDWAKEELTFVEGRTGLVCLELHDILAWAQRAAITRAPNPTYSYTEVIVDRDFAERRLEKLGVDPVRAREVGSLLYKSVRSMEQEIKHDIMGYTPNPIG